MRILAVGNMYPPHHLGGYELTWQSAMRQLRRDGHAVRVVTTDYRSPAPEAEDEDPDVHRELRWYWEDHEFPRLGLRARIALERRNAAALDRHVADFVPDALSWWGMGGMSLGLIERGRRRGLAAVGVVEDDWIVYGPEVDQWTRIGERRPRLGRLLERATGLPAAPDLGAAAHWIFVSEATRQGALAGRALPSTAVEHLGIDTGLFRPAPPAQWTWRLLYLGRIDPRKGIALCIEALRLMPAHATLTVAGAGDERHLKELRDLAADLGLGDRVEFVRRPRRAVPELYAAADVVLFPVLWSEPWGLVPLEAMAVGRPVITSGRGGQAEYARAGENCVVVDPDLGPGALAAAVARLAADAALRERLRHGGMKAAAQHTEDRFNRAVAAALRAAARR